MSKGFKFGAMAAVITAIVVPHRLSPAAAPSMGDTEKTRFYEEQVKPVLEASCIKCHGGEKTKGGLQLTSRQTILSGGDTGPAVSLDDPAKSLLLKAISYDDDNLQMPPKKKLGAAQMAILTKWVEQGVPHTGTAKPAVAVATRKAPPPVNDESRKFWSFQPVKRPVVPQVQHAAWGRNAVDAFILAKLEAAGLEPAPPATKAALLRRAYYDLIGLPPSPAEVDAFLADQSPHAYEAVVDRLLACPQYGEKWGRHWLDLVRFAETNSYERDGDKPNAWRFRDYVIRAFNADKPYDRFVQEQLAGDEITRDVDDMDPIIATGFYRLGIWDDEPADRLQQRYDNLDDIVATTGQTFLGLTVDCARCHDHKLDPILQKDYYRLLSFFHNITPYSNGGRGDLTPLIPSKNVKAYEDRLKEKQRRMEQLDGEILSIEKNFRQLVSGQKGDKAADTDKLSKQLRERGVEVLGAETMAHYQQLRKERELLNKPEKAAEMALAVAEHGPNAPDTFVLMRGNANVPGVKVAPGFLSILSPGDLNIPTPPPGAKSSGRRTLLANWIASKENALTARVMVNRVFQYHFGRGLVRSANNFGFQGDKPTHPELLDYLASEFVDGGWKLKSLHRLLMTSSTYRMASTGDENTMAAAHTKDPRNDLFWRFDLRRLTAEEVRDSILAVNGTLNLKMFGPSMYPRIPAEVLAGQSIPGRGWGNSSPEEAARRSIYVFSKRSLRLPILEGLDGPELDKSCPVRFVTVQPTQALSMLNSTFLNEEAAKLAKRLATEAGNAVTREVTLALRLALCRPPVEAEVQRGLKLIHQLRTTDGASPEIAMKYFSLMVYNLNEFVYLD